MTKPYKFLFTCVGRRVELIQVFKNESIRNNIDLIIYGTDYSTSAPALFFCDEKREICKISDSNYINELLKICKDENIDLVIPTIDTDLLLLSQNKNEFLKIGTRVLISDEDKIQICRDKRKTADYFNDCGLLTPKTYDNVEKYNKGFPCFIKPLNGSSSINAFKVENAADLQLFSSRVDDYIIQPYIHGIEYTVDIFCDFNGNATCITPRIRLAVRSGEVLKTQISNDSQIIEECKLLTEKFKPCGPITVQLIHEQTTGKNYYIEINPRFGGGAPLSILAGANSVRVLFDLLGDNSDNNLKNELITAENDLIYCRFDQSICINGKSDQKCIEKYKAVIFDLDDTLYSEKEYIRSGFKSIEASLSDVTNIADKLWDAFLRGESAIDYVLKCEGIYSDELKDKYLNIYRYHLPNINLYEGLQELLILLKSSGIKVGIITDGRPEGQNAKIDALGIRNLVDEIVITDELGGIQFRKPNDIAYRIMQNRFGFPYETMIYVGDNPRKDFIAPLNLGMGCIYFRNMEGLYSKTSSSCEMIDSISQLIDRIKNITTHNL